MSDHIKTIRDFPIGTTVRVKESALDGFVEDEIWECDLVVIGHNTATCRRGIPAFVVVARADGESIEDLFECDGVWHGSITYSGWAPNALEIVEEAA